MYSFKFKLNAQKKKNWKLSRDTDANHSQVVTRDFIHFKWMSERGPYLLVLVALVVLSRLALPTDFDGNETQNELLLKLFPFVR